MIEFELNGKTERFEGDSDTPLLWVIRDKGLTGTKFGCGMAQCGACTVHMDGIAVRSCVKRISEIAGKNVTTIEGLETKGTLHPVQKAWIQGNVPQCGYCQSGQIMAATALLETLRERKQPLTDEDIDIAMSGNICRCGTYVRIRQAIHEAARQMGLPEGQNPL